MKRCIICGNVGDENSTTCEKCGNPYVDMPDDTADTVRKENTVRRNEPIQKVEKRREEKKNDARKNAENGIKIEVRGNEKENGEEEARSREERQEAGRKRTTTASAVSPVPPRRRRSGPQIYGQENTVGKESQGMVRREVSRHPEQERLTEKKQGMPEKTQEITDGHMPEGVQKPAGSHMPEGVQRPAGSHMPEGVQRPAGNRMPEGSQRSTGIQRASVNRTAVTRIQNPEKFQADEMKDTARAAIKSPLFILIAVLNTICVASSIAAIFMKELNFSLFARLLNGVDLPTQFVGYIDKLIVLMSKLDTDAVAVNLGFQIPEILFCLGLWLILVMAVTAKEEMSGIGFLLVKIVLIIGMVKNCLIVLAGLIISVALVVAAWVSGGRGMTVASVVTLVIMIIAAMMVIMYYFSYMATFKSIYLNAGKGELYGRASVYVAILNIILALTSVVNLLSGIVNMEISSITGAIGKMGWMILLSVWMISYRNEMSEFEE